MKYGLEIFNDAKIINIMEALFSEDRYFYKEEILFFIDMRPDINTDIDNEINILKELHFIIIDDDKYHIDYTNDLMQLIRTLRYEYLY